ncbi:pentapeptide repeat-containing protein [Actinosynnema sp. CS-041913]|uniref:pentapeptide repeat-containing protein n=1 Tax=Actinosynnema sp. CS-041913 TaxID=3239917 RepID=UPI003D8B8CCF
MASGRPFGEGVGLLAFGTAVLVLLGLGVSGVLRWHGPLTWLRDHAPLVALLLLGIGCLAAGAAVVRRPVRPGSGTPLRPLRWWMIAAGLALVTATTWIGLTAVLGLAPATDPTTRLDAVKTGLGIGAAGAGALALLVTMRRQWLGERTQAHAEIDATERRVTELYHKAADQFGTDKDPVVRLAGLYALERLAQQHPEHRKTIVDVICTYLRIPVPVPSGMRKPGTPRRDDQVRLAAQRILADHLRPVLDRRQRPTNAKFWPDTDLDLSGATLADLDLSDCHLRAARFVGARFAGTTTFQGTRFVRDTAFAGARFAGPVEFRNAAFSGDADFTAAHFDGDVVFRTAHFAGAARFTRSRTSGEARFLGTEFRGDTEFTDARFLGPAEFVGARFAEHRALLRAHFADVADLRGVEVGAPARPRPAVWRWFVTRLGR